MTCQDESVREVSEGQEMPLQHRLLVVAAFLLVVILFAVFCPKPLSAQPISGTHCVFWAEQNLESSRVLNVSLNSNFGASLRNCFDVELRLASTEPKEKKLEIDYDAIALRYGKIYEIFHAPDWNYPLECQPWNFCLEPGISTLKNAMWFYTKQEMIEVGASQLVISTSDMEHRFPIEIRVLGSAASILLNTLSERRIINPETQKKVRKRAKIITGLSVVATMIVVPAVVNMQR